MTKIALNINNFSRGEVSDLAFFHSINQGNINNQAKKIQNLLITPFGALVRRPGTEFVNNVFHNEEIKIITLEHLSNSLMIEVSKEVFKFYINGKPIIKNNVAYIISHPFNNEEAFNSFSWCYDSSNLAIYLFAENTKPRIITFDNSYTFYINEFNFFEGPYEDLNQNLNNTMKIDGISGSNKYMESSFDLFTIEDVGRLVRIGHNGIFGEAKINGFINSKKVLVDVLINFLATTPSSIFSLGSWCKKNGYPSKATIFNGRMYLTNSKSNKKTIWISKLWNYSNFSPVTRSTVEGTVVNTVASDNAINMQISEGTSILWLNNNKNAVLFGTQSGIYSIHSIDPNQLLSPYNATISQISSQKSSSVALSTDYFSIYCNLQKKNLFSVEVMEDKALSIQNINFQAEHLFISPIKDITLINYPFSMLFVLLENGTLLGSTIFNTKDGNSYAWHSHIIGGNNTKVLSFASSYNEEYSYLWLYVLRTTNGIENRTIEVLKFPSLRNLYFYLENNITYYLDGYKFTNLINNEIKNLDDFNQKKLNIVAKNKEIYLGEHLVEDNKITIDIHNYENLEVVYGYNFISIYESEFLETSDFNSLFLNKKIEEFCFSIGQSKNLILEINNKIYEISVGHEAFLDTNSLNNNLFINENNTIKRFTVDCRPQTFLNFKILQKEPYHMVINSIKAFINLS